jgi:hypothetical protein
VHFPFLPCLLASLPFSLHNVPRRNNIWPGVRNTKGHMMQSAVEFCYFICFLNILLRIRFQTSRQQQKQTNSLALSPQAKYTDRAAAIYWRNVVWSAQRVPTAVKLSFLNRRCYHTSSSSVIKIWFRRKLRGDWILVMHATNRSRTFCPLASCQKMWRLEYTRL